MRNHTFKPFPATRLKSGSKKWVRGKPVEIKQMVYGSSRDYKLEKGDLVDIQHISIVKRMTGIMYEITLFNDGEEICRCMTSKFDYSPVHLLTSVFKLGTITATLSTNKPNRQLSIWVSIYHYGRNRKK